MKNHFSHASCCCCCYRRRCHTVSVFLVSQQYSFIWFFLYSSYEKCVHTLAHSTSLCFSRSQRFFSRFFLFLLSFGVLKKTTCMRQFSPIFFFCAIHETWLLLFVLCTRLFARIIYSSSVCDLSHMHIATVENRHGSVNVHEMVCCSVLFSHPLRWCYCFFFLLLKGLSTANTFINICMLIQRSIDDVLLLIPLQFSHSYTNRHDDIR